MQIEFYTPAPGCFNGTTFFRPLGSDKYIPIEQLDANTQRLIYMLFNDNNTIHKYIQYLKDHGITELIEVLSKCIVRFFPKLDHVWDIDESKLNIEIN